jgi:hypothetical protein
MPSSYQIKTSLPHVLKEQKYLLLFKIPPKLLLYYYSRKWILEKYLLQNPKSQRMEDGTRRERERESGKSSSITIAQDMVSWE